MADIDDLDDFGREEILRRLKLDIVRMQTQIAENEFKLFMMEKERKRLEQSIAEAQDVIKVKEADITKHMQLWNK